MVKLPIALQLFSVRDDAEKDFEGTLREVKRMGYDGVEFAGLYGHSAEYVKALCCEIGLEIVSAHVPLGDLMADPEGVIDTYCQLGCRQIVIPYLTEEYRPGAEGFDTLIQWAKKLGAMCKEKDLRLAYHNHDFEFTKLGEDYALDILYREVPADCLETQLDTCWVFVGGEDPTSYVKKYAGREYTVHLKDFWVSSEAAKGHKAEKMYQLIGIENCKQVPAEDGQPFCLRPLGYGLQNMPSIVNAAQDAGAQWLIVEQDAPSMGKGALECAQMSVEYLRGL